VRPFDSASVVPRPGDGDGELAYAARMGLFRSKPAPASRDRDLDETRRLAYMALSGAADKRDRQLAGTLVNALVHHQKAADAAEAMAQVTALLANPQDEAARLWMSRHVARITGILGD
jgi:hypothetical protein